MILFIILGVVVLAAFILLGVLFFMLSKEKQEEEQNTIPITNLVQIKKELSQGQTFVPPLEPKVTLPLQAVQAPVQDDIYKKRVEELEVELKVISQKADGQSSEARQMIADLTKENESLKSQQVNLEQAQQKLVDLQGEASGLKIENNTLQTQLDSTNAKVHFLEEEMAAVKIQMGEEITRANALVTELKNEKESILSAPIPETDDTMRQELESLKIEHAKLQQKYDDVVKNQQAMQYELIKARAQSSGLERVSFNYKNQMEDFFKKINAVQLTNDQLVQVKNRLEGMVEEVRSQNEELTHKDQLAQFELEKNRSRLMTLEREYEELKSRVQQNDQQ